MSAKQQCLQKFEDAVQRGNSKGAVAALNEFRRDHVDMYFVQQEFSQEFTTLLYNEWNTRQAEIWENLYKEFHSLILNKDILSVFSDPRSLNNFWIYEAFVRAGAFYPTDDWELFMCAIQGGSWECVKKSLPVFNIQDNPEIVFLGLFNTDTRVYQNLYHHFPEHAVEGALVALENNRNIVNCPNPKGKSISWLISSEKRDALKDFLSEQQKLRLLNHVDGGGSSRTRKI